MDLSALKDLLSDVPDTDAFDLDDIIAEVTGGAPAQPHERVQQPVEPVYAPPQAAPAAQQPLRTAPKTKQAAQAVADELLAPDDEADDIADDPRAARIAAREVKAAARQQRAAAKAAAKQARRAAKQQAQQMDEPVVGADDLPPMPGEAEPPAQPMTRKQARAARIAAEQAEEEAEIELCDPAQEARTCKRRARGLTFRALLVLLLAAAAAYLSVAPSFEQLPWPSQLAVPEQPAIITAALLLLQFIALFVGVDVFGKGFYDLFRGQPGRTTLVSFAVLAALLHGTSLIVFTEQGGVTIPYIAVSLLLLYGAMREERNCYAARAHAYQAFCAAEQPMAVYSHYDAEDDACRAVKGPLYRQEDFLVELERPDAADRFSMIYVPIALAASIIFALVASVGRGQPLRFFWAFSAILSVSAPLGLICAFGASYKNVSRRLRRAGAAIAGARQANLLRDTEEVVLRESDLFPRGSISLVSLQNMGQISDDRVLACAAALADAAGLELGRVLTEATRERYGVTLAARSVQPVEGGLSGQIGTSRVILGTAALMIKMGIRIHAGQGEQVCVYLVVDEALAGVLTLRYQPTKHTYQAMRLMRRMHMNAVLAVEDLNISPAMVEEVFDLRRGFADQPDPAGVARLLDPAYAAGDPPAAILTREGAGSYLQVLRCADKLAGAVRSALTLSTCAGVGGMLLAFYMVSQQAVDALSVLHLLLYVLLWYVPVFLIGQQTH